MIEKRIVIKPNGEEVEAYIVYLPKLKYFGFDKAFLMLSYNKETKELVSYISFDQELGLQFVGVYTMSQRNVEVLMENAQTYDYAELLMRSHNNV